MFSHFPGVLKIDTRLVRNGTRQNYRTSGRTQWVISGSYRPFSAVLEPSLSRFNQILGENRHLLIFQIWQMSNNITGVKILKSGSTVRVPLLNRGPLLRSNCDTVVKNFTNLIAEVSSNIVSYTPRGGEVPHVLR